MKPFMFEIELNVLNHLGIGLYSSTPSVITEIIANSWDADAREVIISVDPDKDIISITDDGHGMRESDVRGKFLKIGYSRRDKEPNGQFSKSGKRRVMGRKGIGKLAMFSLADRIEISTKVKGGAPISVAVNVTDLKTACKENKPYELEPLTTDWNPIKGTRIVLKKLNSRINKTADHIRPRLARRFGVLGEIHHFKVTLNKRAVTRQDAGFYDSIQFLWFFDDRLRDEVSKFAGNIAKVAVQPTNGKKNKSGKKGEKPCIQKLKSDLFCNGKTVNISGFIATVDKPAKLGRGDECINKISIFAHGRVFQEDILPELGDARYFNSYIIGEVHADFIDEDEIDRATASREAIKHDDPEFQALRSHLKSCMEIIRDKWDEWRRELGYVKTGDAHPVVTNWINSLPDKRDQRLADRLMTSISNMTISNDDKKNLEAKKQLYRSTIVGFEKLRARKQLDDLETITDVLSPEFQAIFSSLDDIEESHYLEITRSRLEIIKKFSEDVVDKKRLEKIAQQYLFEHLWLLDPTWGRVSGSETMEQVLTQHLKKKCPDAGGGARLDIAYRTSTGRHVIIELKRPGRKTTHQEMYDQCKKYVEASEHYIKQHPDLLGFGGKVPPIDVYALVSEKPKATEREEQELDLYRIQFITYAGLIANAEKSYEEYLNVHKLLGKLDKILIAL